MSHKIHIISDLHLCEERPHLTALFQHFMQHIAPQSQQLFVLGDLFEVWVGDDNLNDFNQEIIQIFQNYARTKPLYFMHGNRDFLLGSQFSKLTGGIILDEPYECVWQNKKVGLMHGDVLCTDDIEYQNFRTMVRTPEWQRQFLSQPLENRLAYAQSLREKSMAEQKNKTSEIMDVNQEAVIDNFQQYNYDWLIHGHTHREGMHTYQLNNEKTVKRIVLSDWEEKGHYLEIENGEYQSCYFSL